jgi:uncharacterized membrane protein YphA (DoxX/SURF4 family)
MIAFGCALLLCAVFVLAGVSKLRSPGTTRDAAVALGLPHALAPAVSRVLPPVELLVALGLAVPYSRRWAGMVAGAMLGAFTLVVAANLGRKERPSCNCFGAARTRPISWATVARNVTLIALAVAVAVAWDPHVTTGQVASVATPAVMVVEALALALGGWMLLNLTRSQARLLARVEELEKLANPVPMSVAVPAVGTAPHEVLATGTPMPDVPVTLDGTIVGFRELLAPDRPTLLVLVSEHCGGCTELVNDDLPVWSGDPDVTVIAASLDRPSAGASVQRWLGADTVRNLAIRGTPAGVLLDAAGVVAQPPRYGAVAIREMMAGVRSDVAV